MSRWTKWSIAAAAALAFAPAARAADDQAGAGKNMASKHDNTDLIKKLYGSNVAEIQMAKLAEDNAQSDGVKQFAKRMEKDHGEIRDSLSKLAKDRNMRLDEKTELKPHQMHLDAMKKMKGAPFDEHYVQMMVSEHDKDLAAGKAALQRAKQSGDDELATALESAQTKMTEHKQMAMQLDRNKGQMMGQSQGQSEHGQGKSEHDAATTAPSSSPYGEDAASKSDAGSKGDAKSKGDSTTR